MKPLHFAKEFGIDQPVDFGFVGIFFDFWFDGA
jgi:hypothetical protein